MSLQQALLLPVFLHMLMTMGLGVASALARRTALLTGRVRMNHFVKGVTPTSPILPVKMRCDP